jgi:UDP-N-acetylmuramoylalanine--D-glutamate ligase
LIGEDANRIQKDLGRIVPYEQAGAMPQAVQRAARRARPGDVVLLSPACASFDQYQNYEQRGRHFKQLVKKLR